MLQSTDDDTSSAAKVVDSTQATAPSVAGLEPAEFSASFPLDLGDKILWSPASNQLSKDPGESDTQPVSSGITFSDGILSEVTAHVSYALSPAVQAAALGIGALLDDAQKEKKRNANDSKESASHAAEKDIAKNKKNEEEDEKDDAEGVLLEPMITLYYPRNGCHDIIDSLVQSVASTLHADVVVLDSLELAKGELGHFGKAFARAIDIAYHPANTAETNIREDEGSKMSIIQVQSMFHHLVSIERDTCGDSRGPDTDVIKPRIIYMRDFGSIASSAKPLLLRLLRSLHARRTAKFGQPSTAVDCESLIQPTVLILGYTITPLPEMPNSDDELPHFLRFARGGDSHASKRLSYASKAFPRGGTALTSVLPDLDRKLITLEDMNLPPSVHPFSATFFFTSLSPPKCDNDLRSNHSNPRPTLAPYPRHKTPKDNFNLTSVSICLSVFPEESQHDSFREVELRIADARKRDVANAWLRICLGQRGALDCVTPLDLIKAPYAGRDSPLPTCAGSELSSSTSNAKGLLEELANKIDSPLSVALDHIATIAAGLSSLPSPSGKTSLAVQIDTLSRAYQLAIRNWGARSDWIKAVYSSNKEDNEKSSDQIVQRVREAKDLHSHEKKLLGCIVDIENLATTFKDVCLPISTIDTLRTIVSLPLKFPEAFKSGILAREAIGGILLYGPPGTGKTLLCRALARECGARMLSIKPSDIMDCYVGESEKLAKSVFTLAYRLAPCVIFIDEIDSLFRARQGKDDRQYYRNILNEFLQSMDGLQSAKANKDAGVVVIGATNRPQDLDEAVLRRLSVRMMVDLPGDKERENILSIHLRDEKLAENVKLEDIARNASQYSGSDLKNLCVSAALASVKEAVGNFTWANDGTGTPGGEKGSKDAAALASSAEKIINRAITQDHFTRAFGEVAQSSSLTGHSELRRWHEQFGKKSTTGGAVAKYGVGTGRYGGTGGTYSSVGSAYNGTGSGYGGAGKTYTSAGGAYSGVGGSYTGAGSSYAGRPGFNSSAGLGLNNSGGPGFSSDGGIGVNNGGGAVGSTNSDIYSSLRAQNNGVQSLYSRMSKNDAGEGLPYENSEGSVVGTNGGMGVNGNVAGNGNTGVNTNMGANANMGLNGSTLANGNMGPNSNVAVYAPEDSSAGHMAGGQAG